MASLLARCDGVRAVGQARDAAEAVRRATLPRPDVVLIDLVMPEGGGEATRRILAERPELSVCVLLITGWGLELEAERVHESGVTDILPKPFDGERLRTKLAAITAPVAARA